MNNLYSAVSSTLGFTRAVSVEPEVFPVLLDDILIKPNDLLTDNNFNYSLSCLYQNFLSIASDSYLYSPNFPVTNQFLDDTNNIVGTLCGTFVPINYNNDQSTVLYYVNGIPHTSNAYFIVYTTHDFNVTDDYITLAVGLLSATTLTSDLSANTYETVLGVYNFPLSAILENNYTPNNSSSFGDQGENNPYVYANFGFNTKFLNKNLNLKFNSITKLKFKNDKLYVLDSVSNKFLIYDASDLIVNRTNKTNFAVPLETLGFASTTRVDYRNIASFCVNENYIALFNYVNNAISIFSTNLNELYSYGQDKVSVNGTRNTEKFADIEFDPAGNLYLLTQAGTVYVYTVSNTNLTLVKTYNITPTNTTVFSTLSSFQATNQKEVFKKISFSNSDRNVLYVSTNTNIYKRFVDKNVNIGQFNNSLNNTTYYSTLSNIADPFNTLMVPNSADYPNEKSSFDFYKYRLNSISSSKLKDYELFSVCFTDNCTYTSQHYDYYVGNITPYGSVDFISANNNFGMNPVSASGITFIVDRPNYINLNNAELSSIQIYSFDEIKVNSEEFVTDFTVNKSFRKLLYSIYNYQTYQAFKPVVDIDLNNNALFKNLEYIVSYDKDLGLSNFNNFVGINEITSTVFLNRCFSKIYELLETLKNNISSRVINVYPRFTDSVLLNQTAQKFVSIYNDSAPYVSGEYDTQTQPLNPNLCLVEPVEPVNVSPVPTSTPAANPANSFPTPTPTPAPSPTLPPTPTPSGYVLVNKTIQHVATVYLDNQYEYPVPVAPYPNFDVKPLSAIYDGSGIETIVSEFSAFFDQSAFLSAIASVNGDYTKLVGLQFGDYLMQSYTPASNTEYTISGKTCITPTPTPSITPTPSPT